MSNMYTAYGYSPAIFSMFDSKKGSFGNRIDCTVHRAVNDARSTVETGVLGATTFAGYKAINAVTKGKSFKWNNAINKSFGEVAKSLKNMAKDISKSAISLTGINKYAAKTEKGFINVLKSGFEKLSKTTGRQKLLGILGLAAVGTLIAIERKHAFKEGQYEQKYNDIAKKQ